MPRGLKDRQLLEAELALVRHEIATRQSGWLDAQVMRASAETLEWLLAGKASPGPISGEVIDPSNVRELRAEARRAEETMHNPTTANPSADDYERGAIESRANGVHRTLEWATGGLPYTARGQEDWAILDELADVLAEAR